MHHHGGVIGVISSQVHGSAGSTFFFEIPATYDTSAPDEDIFPEILELGELRGIEPVEMGLENIESMVEMKSGHKINSKSSLGTRPLVMDSPGSADSRRAKKLNSCLIVDDSDVSRKILRKILTNFFTNISDASDGAEAYTAVQLRMSQGDSYDYIFMDQEMPEMKGSEAILLIRKLNYTEPIISITGHTEEKDMSDILASGATKVLVKPLKLEIISKLISEGMRGVCMWWGGGSNVMYASSKINLYYSLT